MDRGEAAALRDVLALTGAPAGWVEESTQFGAVLRRAPKHAGGLLLVGPQEAEPWHMAAHLGDEARLCGMEQLAPVLVRHAPEIGAPAHLATGLERVTSAGRGEALLVVAGWDPDEDLLERLGDARRHGARILALEQDAAELRGLAHDSLTVPPPEPVPSALDLDSAQHLVSLAAGSVDRGGVRRRLGRWLDAVGGPKVDPW